jgi:hypothetical protein
MASYTASPSATASGSPSPFNRTGGEMARQADNAGLAVGLFFLVTFLVVGIGAWYCWSLWKHRARARQFAKPRAGAVVDYEDRHSGRFVASGAAKPLPAGVLPLNVVAAVPGGKGLLSSAQPAALAPRPPAGASPRAKSPSPFPSLSAPRANPLSASAVVVANPAAGFS